MGVSLDDITGDGAPEAENITVVQYATFVTYINKAVAVLLPEEEDVPPALNSALSERNNQDCVYNFLSDPKVSCLFVQRISSKDDDGDQSGGEGKEEKDAVIYCISNDVHFTDLKTTSMVCVKRGAVIEADKSINSQLRLINFSEDSPCETLHALVSKTISPYFKSYVKESGRADRDGDKMALSVEQKLAELEMGLLYLQQNIDIPEISLPVHPIVAAVIKRCSDEGCKPEVADFGEKVEDSSFLNQLQNGVNCWIKEIQKVTKLVQDPLSGTTLQEISFCLNLERALHRIQEKRESLEVFLTLDILKHGKRLHATLSFDTDTGLKEALAIVNDYSPLMKNFPINKLLSATEFDDIKLAVQLIFSYLRRIIGTKYPIQRVPPFVEAISRDLSSQLLKVLATRRLMHIPSDEFEKVMGQCFDVFSTWDEEYYHLLVLLRDIAKLKRVEHVSIYWRLSRAHKRLQTRMEDMRSLRHQHKQLHTVIMRVLHPTLPSIMSTRQIDQQSQLPRTPHQPKAGDMKPEVLALEASDVNAIEEVNLAYENVKVVDCLDISHEGLKAWDAAVRRYGERVDRVERRLTAHLRDQLGTTKNANEMFRIFSRFRAIFGRPHIRDAVHEYQTQLIQRVKDDTEALHEKFKV